MALRSSLTIPLISAQEEQEINVSPLAAQKEREKIAPSEVPKTESKASPLRVNENLTDSHSTLFSAKNVGDHSPEKIKEAFEALKKTLAELKKLPDPIKNKLTLPDESTIQFDKILSELNEVLFDLNEGIEDEKFKRRLIGLGIGLGLFCGGQLVIRGLVAALFYVTDLISPGVLCTPTQAACFGWQIAKWPAFIAASISSMLGGVGCGCIKGNTEENLITLQQLIDRSINQIRLLDKTIKAARTDQLEIELKQPSLSSSTN